MPPPTKPSRSGNKPQGCLVWLGLWASALAVAGWTSVRPGALAAPAFTLAVNRTEGSAYSWRDATANGLSSSVCRSSATTECGRTFPVSDRRAVNCRVLDGGTAVSRSGLGLFR